MTAPLYPLTPAQTKEQDRALAHLAAMKRFYDDPTAPDVPAMTIGVTRLPKLTRIVKELKA